MIMSFIIYGDSDVDAFEQLVSEVLWREGYWVSTSVKVNLTKPEKVEIGRPSSPRWELDIVAYSGRENLLRVVECKSFIDSRGVQASELIDPNNSGTRYKLFRDDTLRRVVFSRLAKQFEDSGACRPNPEIRLGMACGKIGDERGRAALVQHFANNGWDLLDENWLKDRLRAMAADGYENQVSAVVAKLLLRGQA